MLIFLKLGGSLITDKTHPYTPCLNIIDNLATQVANALQENKELKLILGHGSGSFGHQAASQFGTLHGVSGPEEWHGFAEVWYQASALNRLVIDALRRAGLPAVTLSPCSAVTGIDGQVAAWDLTPMKAALANGLLPVIHGDVVIDKVRGGTILSTEDLFAYLAHQLCPKRILLAGLETGVWGDFPGRTFLIEGITPQNYKDQSPGIGPSNGTDVTGGMQEKVARMLELVEQVPGLEVLIFSGVVQGNVAQALSGGSPGTRLHR